MSNQVNDAVSIQLRNSDEESAQEDTHMMNICCALFRNSDEESAQEDGTEKQLPKAMRWWETFFIMICGFGAFIDPLFCYIYVMEGDKMCVSSDEKALWAYFGLRIAIDVFYVIDIIIFLCGLKDKKFWACGWNRRNKPNSRIISLKELIYLLRLILVALPIPEGLVVCAFMYGDFDPFYAILIIVPFQYMVRIYFIYGSKRWRPIKRRWVKPLLDLLPFILASYLFGALWYHLAVQRQIDCWKPHCEVIRGDNCTKIKDFTCDKELNQTMIMLLQKLCPTDSENKTAYDFGIYLYALQSYTTSSSDLPRRMSQSFWWALRNLSSFGSNLVTSMHTLEIYFSIVISISGMALFLVYLNARVKDFESKYTGMNYRGKKCKKLECLKSCPKKILKIFRKST